MNIDEQIARIDNEEILKEYTSLQEKIQAEISKVREIARQSFDKGILRLIETFNLKSVVWYQYTPYWNDGDACIFRVGEVFVDGYSDYGESSEEYGVYLDESEIVDPPENEAENSDRKKIAKAVTSFVNSFSDDDMEFLFGDHAQITYTKDGHRVEGYEHD